ncbi:unnamed protein product [Brassica rapa]|uniref:Uncharacterized protein n=2 Tax=Brassica TaxID=3705 RepID=A0A8D9HAP3_BRACM|nr:unnamed protein product [Brassica napus]CAG7894484.1 unnamed protein product [Brassica rapa]
MFDVASCGGSAEVGGVLFLVFVCDGIEPGLFMLYSASCKGSPVLVQGIGALALSALSRGRLIVKRCVLHLLGVAVCVTSSWLVEVILLAI